MNPVEEYLSEREGLEKKAFGQALKSMAGPALAQVGVGGLQAAGAAGVMGLGGAVMKAYSAIRKHRDYKSMMEHNPDLHEMMQENPKQFGQFYSSFRSMNPSFAQDPVISGTYMRQMGHAPQHAGKIIVESLEGASKMKPSVEIGFQGGGFSGDGFDLGRPSSKMKR